MKLLSNGKSNSKIAKNLKIIDSYILHLSPYKQNSYGKNVCAHASVGCASACLNTAGRGAFSNVQSARVRKTDWLLSDSTAFLQQLLKELIIINSKGKAAVRLNGTSDLDFIDLIQRKLDVDVVKSLTNIKFYDYTKNFKRAMKYLGSDYHLTLSRSEDNDDKCIEYLRAGGNVAAVFNNLPQTWNGFTVIDGDENDLRYLDYKNVVVGLVAKGKAKKDTSGFVIQTVYDDAI